MHHSHTILSRLTQARDVVHGIIRWVVFETMGPRCYIAPPLISYPSSILPISYHRYKDEYTALTDFRDRPVWLHRTAKTQYGTFECYTRLRAHPARPTLASVQTWLSDSKCLSISPNDPYTAPPRPCSVRPAFEQGAVALSRDHSHILTRGEVSRVLAKRIRSPHCALLSMRQRCSAYILESACARVHGTFASRGVHGGLA